MRHESGALRPDVPVSDQAQEPRETAELGRYHQSRRILIAIAIIFAFVVTGVVRSSWGHGVHEMIEAGGIFLIAAGILGRMWSVLYIGSRKSRELIALGPYSVTRNPL
jgi:protein-S-isoprenylcysteine O-methyltransferase Ste14